MGRERHVCLQLFSAMFFLFMVLPGSHGIANGQGRPLGLFFMRAKSDAALRHSFISEYVQRKGLPEHIVDVRYSEKQTHNAVAYYLVGKKRNLYTFTSHTVALGRGYPSLIEVGPNMFYRAYVYADFENVIQHEAAHAKFWATAETNYLGRLDEDDVEDIRTRGLRKIVFELDAIKTQMDHPSWERASQVWKYSSEAYRQQWIKKFKELQQRPFMYDMRPLFKKIRYIYGIDNRG